MVSKFCDKQKDKIIPDVAQSLHYNISDKQAREWEENGLLTLHSVFSKSEINAYNKIVETVRASVKNGQDEYGYGDRIGQLHQSENELINFAANSQIVNFLSWAFGDEPILFGSLNFDKGTQQEVHIDAIFFYPEPSYSMAGVWVALEDIDPDSGPLFYLPGSHKWGFERSDELIAAHPEFRKRRNRVRKANADPAEKNKLVSDMASAWTKRLIDKEIEKKAVRLTQPIKAGDVVIWHSLLAHGGSPRLDERLSRKSAVFHYIGRKTRLYTYDEFFLWGRKELENQVPQPLNLRMTHGFQSMRYDYFVTYHENQEMIHKL